MALTALGNFCDFMGQDLPGLNKDSLGFVKEIHVFLVCVIFCSNAGQTKEDKSEIPIVTWVYLCCSACVALLYVVEKNFKTQQYYCCEPDNSLVWGLSCG
jgi:hypothetical protein